MRTTPSRFSAFAGTAERPVEGWTVTRAPTLVRPTTTQPETEIERYPHVVRALTLLWGQPEMNQYFEKVWSGQDPTLNLDPAAMADLMMLAAVHQRLCPYRPAKKVEDLYGAGRWADPWKPARVRG